MPRPAICFSTRYLLSKCGMPDAGILHSFRGNDSLAGLFLGPNLVAVAHQKDGADAICCLQNRGCVTEIASHEINPCRHQAPRSVAIRLAGQRPDAISLDSSARARAPSCWPVAPVIRTLRLVVM